MGIKVTVKKKNKIRLPHEVKGKSEVFLNDSDFHEFKIFVVRESINQADNIHLYGIQRRELIEKIFNRKICRYAEKLGR